MKPLLSIALSFMISAPTLAVAGDLTRDAAIGGAVGGALGGAVGAELGGREGAVIGSGVGAALGSTVATRHYGRDYHYRDDWEPEYGHGHYRGHGHRGGPPFGPGGHFCPPGLAKQGRC